MSVWTERDLVVLRYLHEKPPLHGILVTNWIRTDPHPDLPELSQQDVHVAVETLAGEGLVHYANDEWASGGGVHWMGFQVTGAGLQALGEWPVFEALGSPEELGRILDALAEMAVSDEEEDSMRRAASVVRSKGSDLLQSLVAGAFSALVRSQLG
jgi:hypothetical protein